MPKRMDRNKFVVPVSITRTVSRYKISQKTQRHARDGLSLETDRGVENLWDEAS